MSFEIVFEEVPIEKLSVDGKNPNIMTPAQEAALNESLKRYGQLKAIVVNSDYLIADGQHTWEKMKNQGFKTVLVCRINVGEIDRRMLRQVLNKLHGEHNIFLDSEDLAFLSKENALGDLSLLLAQEKLDLEAIAKLIREEKLPEEELKKQVTENKCPNCGYEY